MTVSLLDIKQYSWVHLVKLYGGHLCSRLYLCYHGTYVQNLEISKMSPEWNNRECVSSVNEMLHQSASVELNRCICLCGQIVARGMKARRSGGSIVNVSSQASRCALRDHAIYCEYQCCLTGMYHTKLTSFSMCSKLFLALAHYLGLQAASVTVGIFFLIILDFSLIFSKGFNAALIKSSLYGPK